MKLELKHLSPYLPYEIRCKMNGNGNIETLNGLSVSWAYFSFLNDNYEFYEFKPILRPLSDLTKEIEYNGEKFVPIVELLKIIQTDQKWNLTAKYNILDIKSDIGGLGGEYYSIRYSWEAANDVRVVADLIYDTLFNRFTLRQKEPIEKCQWLRYDVLEEKLLEWNFDKFKLIPAGLAISKNEIDNQ